MAVQFPQDMSSTMRNYFSSMGVTPGVYDIGQFFANKTPAEIYGFANQVLNTFEAPSVNTILNLPDAEKKQTLEAMKKLSPNWNIDINRAMTDRSYLYSAINPGFYDITSGISQNLDMAGRPFAYGAATPKAAENLNITISRIADYFRTLPESMKPQGWSDVVNKAADFQVKDTGGKLFEHLTQVDFGPMAGKTVPSSELQAYYQQYQKPTEQPPITPTGATGGVSYWKSPQGTIFQVPVGSETEANFQRLGYTPSTAEEEAAERPPTGGAPTGGAPTGGTPTGGTPTEGAPTGGATGDQTWVNNLYQKYFDRNATTAEMTNWLRETPEALEQFLTQEAERYGYTSNFFKTQETDATQRALDIINNSTLPEELKALYRDVVKNYPPGVEFDAQEILNTFETIKNETIDPQYRQYVSLAEQGYVNALENLKATREMEIEQQRSEAGEAIRQAKAGLEKAGMTFTGRAIEQLGAQAAIPQTPTAGLPTQEPFGGLFYEGQVPQAIRLASTSTQARYEKALKNLGLSAEQELGTAGALTTGITGYMPVGGITGSLEQEKQREYATTLQNLLKNYQEKQKSLLNLSPT